jgi:hypothetical protein
MTNCSSGTNKLVMNEKNKIYPAQIDELIEKKDFDSLFQLFISNNVSFEELRKVYKRREAIFKSSDFWGSKLAHYHLEGILGCDLKIVFLKTYFSKEQYCNHELNKHLIITAPSDFCKHLKLWQAFKYRHFINSFREISKGDNELERVVKELDIIVKSLDKIRYEEEYDKSYFLQYTLGEIALGFALYYHDFKQNGKITGNKSYQTRIEVALADELNYLFSLFKGKENMDFQFPNNDALQEEFFRNEAPHRILGKKGVICPPEDKFQLLFELIKRLILRKMKKGHIELYLCGYTDFESVILNPAPLRSNSRFKTYSINDTKSVPEELYFSKLRLHPFSSNIHLSKTETDSNIANLKFYGIPESIIHNGVSIEFRKVFQLLKYFSAFKGPAERNFFLDGSFIVKNQGDEKFIECFGSNESLSLFDFNELVNGIAQYFKWTDIEAKSILSFLTFDVSCKVFPNSWVSNPFIKCNNQILWLGSFLKDRRWDNCIINKLKRDVEYVKLVNSFSKGFELRIEELFRSKSFNTISGEKFKSLNGQTGDFDVLAYKDNYLFVCEAKTGLRTSEFIHTTYSETVKLDGTAADQLEKAVLNIEEDWDNLKRKLGIYNDVQFEDIKIVPLIITDYFEGDLQLYKKAYRKISLIELDVMLKNKKRDLLELYLSSTLFINSKNHDIKEKVSGIKVWDLWDGKKEIDVGTIVRNIDGNAIWKELETVWKFEEDGYWIDY